MTPRSFPFLTSSTILTATILGLSTPPAQAEVTLQSEGNGTILDVTIGGPNPGIEFSNAPAYSPYSNIYQAPRVYQSPLNQSFSNIYQYPSSGPEPSHSNIYQPPTVYPQPRYPQRGYNQYPDYDQHPGTIYTQPSVIYRRTEIVSPDGNRRVILEDPQYVVPQNRYYHPRRLINPNRRPSTRIYYRF
jgi:hypothetical protein